MLEKSESYLSKAIISKFTIIISCARLQAGFIWQPCNVTLLKEIKLKDRVAPIKSFPYQSLKTAISNLVCNQEFTKLCDHWRTRGIVVPDNITLDI